MKFSIITLDHPEREHYREAIRRFVPYDEVTIPAVDGRMVNVKEEWAKRDIPLASWTYKMGEAGVWLSNFDNWQWAADNNEELIVFEDDAVVNAGFVQHFDNFYNHLPPEWDFASLWVPENQRVDYQYDVSWDINGDPVHEGPTRHYADSQFKYNLFAAHVYQGYGMVSLMYSPTGAAKLIERARATGPYTPVDCWVYQQAHLGWLDGYAPTPIFCKIVSYDWSAETTVQRTERAMF